MTIIVKIAIEHYHNCEDCHTALPPWRRQLYSITILVKIAIQHYHNCENSHTALPQLWILSNSIAITVKIAIQHYHHGSESKIKPFYNSAASCSRNKIYVFTNSVPTPQKTQFFLYKYQLVNTVLGNNCSLLSESHKTHKYTVSKMQRLNVTAGCTHSYHCACKG
jgi:hypothetical protein